jgi:hypothetical protein
MLIQIRDIEGIDLGLVYCRDSDFKKNHEIITQAINHIHETYGEDYDYELIDEMSDKFYEFLEAKGFERISIEDSFEIPFL